ncbi:MAG: alpha/beta hydrolase [Myxococcota bacterium]
MPAPRARRQLHDVVHDSAALRGNPLGDPHIRQFPVYVPPQYDTQPQRRFPVAWLLSGYGGWGELKATTVRAWEETLPDQLDAWMTSGEIEPMIVAFPDGFTRFGGAQYRDSPATGRYGAYLADELVAEVDARFRTIPDRSHRAVFGKSSGGYGALVMGMTRPEVFGLVCATAADSYFPVSCPGDFGKAFQVFRKWGGPAPFARAFPTNRKRGGNDFSAMMILAYAQCYSPNLEVPEILADLPFDMETGELVDAVWRKWLACDPVEMVQHHVDALKSLELLYLDAGTSDEWYLDVGHRVLASRLRAHGIPHVIEEFEGGHMNIDFRTVESLRQLTRVWRSK